MPATVRLRLCALDGKLPNCHIRVAKSEGSARGSAVRVIVDWGVSCCTRAALQQQPYPPDHVVVLRHAHDDDDSAKCNLALGLVLLRAAMWTTAQAPAGSIKINTTDLTNHAAL